MARLWIAGWSSLVARKAHNLEVAGSNPAPATNLRPAPWRGCFMSAPNCYQVYVIQNPHDRFYIGLSKDVRIRLAQHNDGKSTWTRHRGPWSLVWTSAPMSLTQARKLEIEMKRQKGGIGFYQLTGLQRPQHS
jgi:predicted GIY-YIG superfamily endonuclease